MTFVFICPRKIASSFGYSLALSIVNNFESDRMNYAVKLYKEGDMTVNQICEITNVSRASLYRKLSERNS